MRHSEAKKTLYTRAHFRRPSVPNANAKSREDNNICARHGVLTKHNRSTPVVDFRRNNNNLSARLVMAEKAVGRGETP